MNHRVCPGCQSAMQVFHARGVEIDRCGFCGGLWFDGGELERVLKAPLPFERLPGATSRRCASCTTTLEPMVLRGVPMDVCASCLSVYLDEGELDELAGRRVPLHRAAMSQEKEVTFRCPGCGEDKPAYVGTLTRNGMACVNCFGALGDTHPRHVRPKAALDEHDLINAIDLLVES
ncbi:MAG: zf-TFIIB domain-containing protein [Myxococcota bacterium]